MSSCWVEKISLAIMYVVFLDRLNLSVLAVSEIKPN